MPQQTMVSSMSAHHRPEQDHKVPARGLCLEQMLAVPCFLSGATGPQLNCKRDTALSMLLPPWDRCAIAAAKPAYPSHRVRPRWP